MSTIFPCFYKKDKKRFFEKNRFLSVLFFKAFATGAIVATATYLDSFKTAISAVFVVSARVYVATNRIIDFHNNLLRILCPKFDKNIIDIVKKKV